MTRRTLRFILAIGIVPLLMAPDSITETQVTPNPGGQANKVKDEGTYTVAQGNMLLGIRAGAKDPVTKQLNSIPAGTGVDGQGNLTWNGTISVVAGNYDCFGTLHTKDNMGKSHAMDSNVMNVNVQ